MNSVTLSQACYRDSVDYAYIGGKNLIIHILAKNFHCRKNGWQILGKLKSNSIVKYFITALVEYFM